MLNEIPLQLQCAYCIRNSNHGGECRETRNIPGCLIFKVDERGCIRNADLMLPFPLYYDIPPLKTWSDDWQIKGVNTEVKINWINNLQWDTKRGVLIVYCNCDYFVNEYHENYVEQREKPILKVIK
ncbi:hypothetical protein IAI10_16740 [Clostridium sp. 19966]|uniref:hypothetical protein n=1 Tax=Clostridium sp. 19966 TaxID=2768166 RepID=UPI0028DEB885|nr:hypothetical protein [Clostridium sp. 19966]MDT8718316.1 hypothetical protein [Clostridium sp. 19966]